MKRLLNGVLSELVLTLLICIIALLCIELIPNVSITSMLRLFFITCIILEVLTILWAIFYLRKNYPDNWVELIYPEL